MPRHLVTLVIQPTPNDSISAGETENLIEGNPDDPRRILIERLFTESKSFRNELLPSQEARKSGEREQIARFNLD